MLSMPNTLVPFVKRMVIRNLFDALVAITVFILRMVIRNLFYALIAINVFILNAMGPKLVNIID